MEFNLKDLIVCVCVCVIKESAFYLSHQSTVSETRTKISDNMNDKTEAVTFLTDKADQITLLRYSICIAFQ